MTVLLQLFQYLGGGVANDIIKIHNHFSHINRYVGLFDAHRQKDVLDSLSFVQIGNPDGRSRTLKGWQRRFKDLRKFKAVKQVTVTLSHSPWLHALNILTGGPDKKILIIHSPVTSIRSNRMELILFRLFFIIFDRYTADYVTVSQELQKQVQRWVSNKDKVHCIINGLDASDILSKAMADVPEQVRLFSNNAPFFVSVGRLHQQKNFRFMLSVFAKLKKSAIYRQHKLIIIGEGRLLNNLVAFAQSRGLAVAVMEQNDNKTTECADVLFTGLMANPFNVVKAAQLYMSTSKYEGLPYSVREARLLGKLLAVSDCATGHRELVTGSYSNCAYGMHQHGFLLPIRNKSMHKMLNYWVNFMIKHADIIQDWQSKEKMVIEPDTNSGLQWDQLIAASCPNVEHPQIG